MQGKGLDVDYGNFKQRVLFDSENKTRSEVPGQSPFKYQANKVLLDIALAIGRGEQVSLRINSNFVNENVINNTDSNPEKPSRTYTMLVTGIDGRGNVTVELMV